VKRILVPALLLGVVLIIGTVGYSVIEGWSFFDAFYMTVITLSTVGFREVYDLSYGGKLFTILLVIGGVATVTLLMSTFGRMIVEGEFRRVLWRQKVDKTIDKLSNHFILCGYGRVGREVAKNFTHVRAPFVVVEKEEPVIRQLDQEGLAYVLGDATVEEVLLRAGLLRAKGVVTALENDADNVYVCLTARSLCPSILIVARAADDRAAKNLKQAGADRFISPNVLGGHQIAQACLRPAVLDFITLATSRSTLDLQMEELHLKAPSELIGKSLAGTNLRSHYRVIVVAIQKPSGDMVFHPESHQVLEERDTLILLGPASSLQELVSRMDQ